MSELANASILLGILLGAVLAAALATRRANRLANRILAALVAAVTLMLALGEVGSHWGFAGHPHLLGLAAPLPFLFGPLLYLYAIALTRPIERFDPRWLAHGLPFLGDVLFMAQAFYLKAADEKAPLALAADLGHAPTAYYVVGLLEVVQALTYLVLAWQALHRYGQKMTGYYSDLAQVDLRWLRGLVAAHLVIWGLVLLETALRWSGYAPVGMGPAVQIGSSFAIFLTGYVSLSQTDLAQKATAARMTEPQPEPQPEPEPPKYQPKYQRNRLDDAEAQELEAKLDVLMEKEHLYRESALTLSVLANRLGVPPHALSQLLNVRIGKSFFFFVNTHRVEALKRALLDPAQAGRGVLELAFEVGFSSKSTVNSFFKKLTGTTPTAFRSARSLEESRG